MKNFYFFVLGIIVILSSCVSIQDREISANERVQTQVLGQVEVEFNSLQWLHIINKKNIRQKAHTELLRAAKKQYEGNIEIRNIVITGNWSAWNLLNLLVNIAGPTMSGIAIAVNSDALVPGLLVMGVSFVAGNTQKITTTGDVVLLPEINSSGRVTTGIEGALERAADEVSENFTARSRLAIVYITAQDKSTTDFITGELEHILRRKGFVIIDRSELDRVRAEQRFGTSGEVDDSTAARIGNIAGASIVITGRVDGEGNLRRLRLRALDTSSGQVVGTASERL
ncbi:MAG: CsgG/HfaB family protein [Treponema sp.]|nr:CsgG/HfaB family protein [Treponema sp.]